MRIQWLTTPIGIGGPCCFTQPDLVILYRFGRAESEGYGLRQVLEHAVSEDIPVLIGVREEFRDLWDQFHGGLGAALPPDLHSVLAWCKSKCD